jgi:hypothetical protein
MDLHTPALGISLAVFSGEPRRAWRAPIHDRGGAACPGRPMMQSPATYSHVPELASKMLACAVIKQALADALDPTQPADVRRDAFEFLSGDAWYRRWCSMAGLKPVRLISRRVAA